MEHSDICLIALDLDGTLLNEEKQIHKEDQKIIKEVMASGVIVTLVSARPLCSMLPYAEQLGIQVPLISLSGSYISDMQEQQILLEKPMDLARFKEMVMAFEEKDYYIKAYSKNQLFVQEDDDITKGYSRTFKVPYAVVGKKQLRALDKPPLRMAIFDNVPRIEEARQTLEKWSDYFKVLRDTDRGLEIVEHTVSKGSALVRLCRELNISLEQVMAIGNEGSDLAMIQAAGLGIAMGNACDELKEHAIYVTKGNTECGVGFAIQEYILKKRKTRQVAIPKNLV